MVDRDDTTEAGRWMTDDRQETMPGIWHKLPTGELKTEKDENQTDNHFCQCYLMFLMKYCITLSFRDRLIL